MRIKILVETVVKRFWLVGWDRGQKRENCLSSLYVLLILICMPKFIILKLTRNINYKNSRQNPLIFKNIISRETSVR